MRPNRKPNESGVRMSNKISRSQSLIIALKSYITNYRNQRLLNELNAAYADPPDESEIECQRLMKQKHRAMAMGQW